MKLDKINLKLELNTSGELVIAELIANGHR